MDTLSPKHMKVEISALGENGELIPSEYEEESWDSVDVYSYTPDGPSANPDGGPKSFQALPPVPNKPLPCRPPAHDSPPPKESASLEIKSSVARMIESSQSGVVIQDLGIQIDEHSLTIPAPHSE